MSTEQELHELFAAELDEQACQHELARAGAKYETLTKNN